MLRSPYILWPPFTALRSVVEAPSRYDIPPQSRRPADLDNYHYPCRPRISGRGRPRRCDGTNSGADGKPHSLDAPSRSEPRQSCGGLRRQMVHRRRAQKEIGRKLSHLADGSESRLTITQSSDPDFIGRQAFQKLGVGQAMREKLPFSAPAVALSPRVHTITETPAKPWLK